LPAPSTVRFKLFTLDHRLVRSELGRLVPADEQAVNRALRQLLGLLTER
jgi:mRNA interferase MazF